MSALAAELANIDLGDRRRNRRAAQLLETFAYSDESGHRFRRKAATCSDRIRPPVPKESGQ
jgi:hypothetical protein